MLYEDVNDPRGVGAADLQRGSRLLPRRVRPLLNGPAFAALVQKPEYTMLGRTYSIGYEPDLPEVLLDRPRRTVLNPAGRGRSGTRCGAADGSRSCRPRSSA